MKKGRVLILLGLLTLLILGWAISGNESENKNENESGEALKSLPSSYREPARTGSLSRNRDTVKTDQDSGTLQKQKELKDTLEELSQVLPAWMKEKGMSFEDSREVFGHTVLQSRVRHHWENGSQMEIEIMDMGESGTDEVIKALGFNTEMEQEDNESGVKEVDDQGDGVLTNYEYDHADQAGNLQVLLGGRYLVEIQVEGLSEDSFQEILDRDIDFDALYKNIPSKR